MTSDILYLLIPFAVTLMLGVPIAMCLGFGVLVFLYFSGSLPTSVMSQQMYSAAASFPLMAIPFFVLAGSLMNESGITHRLVEFCKILLQRVRGGLAQSMVVTGTIFAGLTGSATADTAATIKILGPSMEREGYHKEFTAALAASTGVLGPIIPPSTIMIVYGATVGTSVGGLFMGGIVPGIFLGLLLMVTVAIIAKKRGYPKSNIPFTFSALVSGFKDASLALVMPVIILVGIRGGVFTPTEGGAVAVAYSLVIGLFVYRTLTFKKIFETAVSSGITAAIIMLVVAASAPFGWIISVGRVPAMFAETLLSYTTNPIIVLLLINCLLLIVGMFLEGAAIVLLMAPILAPLAKMVGIHPVHFGIIMCVNICVGMITPPVGVNLFVAAPIANVGMTQISRAVLPFLAALMIGLGVISYWPDLTLWLPRLLR
ncbi:TRAP transporter large permease [Desulfovibrio cuneatus]|uniref:TRAP transporter large permease n=1 Tax=Desulfovibrio cuneatus TaxID=159728 RepID=UPI000422A153|nr:TRAP transporter large permease [Desulfovibrio cuneatus]